MRILLIVALLLSSNIVSSDLSYLFNTIEENEDLDACCASILEGLKHRNDTTGTTKLPFRSSDLSYLLNPIKETKVASRSKMVRPKRNKYPGGRSDCLYTGNLLNSKDKANISNRVLTVPEARILYMCKVVDGGKQRFECTFPECGYTTPDSGHYSQHVRRHTNKKLHKCSYCYYDSFWKWNITRHEATEHADVLNCIRPGCVYTGCPRGMRMHKTSCTGHELGCTECNYTVDSERLMKEHLQDHYVERMIFS